MITRESTVAKQRIKSRHDRFVLSMAVVLMVALFIVALCLGRYSFQPGEALQILASPLLGTSEQWSAMDLSVIWHVRLPRAVAAVLIGGGLALSGAAYQGVFQNPLVSPDLLGISEGACVGAAIGILLGFGSAFIQAFALIGGLVAVACATTIPKLLHNNSTLMLVLSGVIVSGFMGAMLGILKYIADPETQLPAITFWQMGSLADVNSVSVLSVLPAIVAAAAVLVLLRWRINILSLGESEAASLGINQRASRTAIIVCSTLLTGCSVCLAGVVGWVGLIIPHLSRLIVGPDNVKLVPMSFVVGGCFMLVIDTIARTATSAEIPLSILTGAIGAPLFIWLLVRTKARL